MELRELQDSVSSMEKQTPGVDDERSEVRLPAVRRALAQRLWLSGWLECEGLICSFQLYGFPFMFFKIANCIFFFFCNTLFHCSRSYIFISYLYSNSTSIRPCISAALIFPV